MTEIVLSAEQAAILASAKELVAIRRPDGSFVGWVSPTSRFIIPNECPFTPDEIAAAEAEADGPGPWYTTKEVLEHLRSLDRSRP
jgi:hypothetical protein